MTQECATTARERGGADVAVAAAPVTRDTTAAGIPYRGVFHSRDGHSTAYRYDYRRGGVRHSRHGFVDAESAALAYDAQMRILFRRVVNFPRPGTREVQAVKGLSDAKTLARLGELASASASDEEQEDAHPPPPRAPATGGDAAAASPPASHKRPRSASPPSLPTFRDAAAFLRDGIAPPLHCLDAALTALPASDIELRHLASAAAASPAFQLIMLDIIFDALRLFLAGDQLALIAALPPLLAVPPRG